MLENASFFLLQSCFRFNKINSSIKSLLIFHKSKQNHLLQKFKKDLEAISTWVVLKTFPRVYPATTITMDQRCAVIPPRIYGGYTTSYIRRLYHLVYTTVMPPRMYGGYTTSYIRILYVYTTVIPPRIYDGYTTSYIRRLYHLVYTTVIPPCIYGGYTTSYIRRLYHLVYTAVIPPRIYGGYTTSYMTAHELRSLIFQTIISVKSKRLSLKC